MTTAVIYSRFSPQPKSSMEGKTTDAQVELCREFCKATGMEVLGEYADIGVSRSDDYGNRPQLWEAVKQCRKGTNLVAYRRDRIGSGTTMLLIERDIVKRGGRVLAVEGANNDDTAEASLLNGILACVDEYEKLKIGARTKSLMLAKQAAGHRVSGRGKEPYGMMTNPEDETLLIENPREQATIARMVQLSAEGLSKYAISVRLYDEGYRSRGDTGRFRHQLVGVALGRCEQVSITQSDANIELSC